ncbi:MAG: DUF1833 family protein [Bermanella sp.]
MSAILQAVYASAPFSEIIHHTLELQHASFPDGAYRWVQGFDDMDLTLETSEQAAFTASGFGVSLPARSMRGNQDLQFKLDNVTGDVLRAIESVLEAGSRVVVTYRVYLSSDLSSPAQAPIVMTANAVSADYTSLSVVADFHDFVNKAWPRLRYTTGLAPGLKYL